MIDCRSCKFIHVIPVPSHQELNLFYDNEYYQKTKSDFISKNENEMDYLNLVFDEKLVTIEKLISSKSKRILDIGSGPDGPTHHAIEDLGIFSTYPGVQVLSPCDANKLEAVLEAAIISGKPTYMRTGRSPVSVIHPPEIKYEIGKDEVLFDGSDVSIFATGIMVHWAIKAMELLKKENISAEIIDITSIKPLDKETILKSVKKTNCAVTAEDHYVRNGMGSGISQLVGKEYLVLTYNIGVEKYAESGNPEDLATKYGLQPENIVNIAKQIVQDK